MAKRSIRLLNRRLRLSVMYRLLFFMCSIALPIYLVSCQPSGRARHDKVEASPAQATPAPKIRLQWQLPSRGLENVAFSPDGEFIGFVDKNGTARCYGSDGMLQWSRNIPGVKHLLVGSAGEFSIACSLLNPVRRELCFLDRKGEIRWTPELEGAPWCVAASEGRDEFAVGTGEGYVYVFTVGQRRRRYVRWKPEGIPTSIAFVRSSDRLLIGTWQESSVARYWLDGSYEWSQKGEQDKLYFAQADATAESVLAMATPNRRIPRSTITVMDGMGNKAWQKELDGAEMKASLSRMGSHTAVGFVKHITHKGKEVPERHVQFYDEHGVRLWDKGGMFFKPRLIGAITPDAVLLCDEKFIYLLDRLGKVKSKEKLPARLKNWWADHTLGKLLVLCSNDRLYCYSVQ